MSVCVYLYVILHINFIFSRFGFLAHICSHAFFFGVQHVRFLQMMRMAPGKRSKIGIVNRMECNAACWEWAKMICNSESGTRIAQINLWGMHLKWAPQKYIQFIQFHLFHSYNGHVLSYRRLILSHCLPSLNSEICTTSTRYTILFQTARFSLTKIQFSLQNYVAQWILVYLKIRLRWKV